MVADASLYGIPRPTNTSSKIKSIPSSTSLAFTSQLSSLLAAQSTELPNHSSTTSGRARPSKSKPDIFTAHNKNSKKRAAADISSADGDGSGLSRQSHQADIGAIDAGVLHRSKRKMEEKARLYAAMKRGDYVPPTNGKDNREENALVDFDRKWAEDEAEGRTTGGFATESDSSGDSEAEEMVEYEDEFGRQRRGTRAEAAREERRRKGQLRAVEEATSFSARPTAPSRVIYGDTVQSAAFNPDEPVAAQMEEIARKRDRSMTPPEEVHYDANGEVRSKGVGFYSFSKDKEGRKREMDALERERIETERARREEEERKERRRRELEERRKVMREKRGEKDAERFLDGLN